jgi:hypothetical protein
MTKVRMSYFFTNLVQDFPATDTFLPWSKTDKNSDIRNLFKGKALLKDMGDLNFYMGGNGKFSKINAFNERFKGRL